MSFLTDFLFGSKPKVKQKSGMMPEQIEAIKKLLQGGGLEGSPLFQQGSDYLQKLLGGDFSAFEAPLMEKFETDVVPGIAERFAGVGAMSSSGLNQALSEAGKSLMTQLGAQRAGLTQSSLGQALGYAQQPISNILSASGMAPYQPFTQTQQGQPGAVGDIMSLVMKLLPLMI